MYQLHQLRMSSNESVSEIVYTYEQKRAVLELIKIGFLNSPNPHRVEEINEVEKALDTLQHEI